MHINKTETDGYNVIMGLVRDSDDPGDPWGSNISWLFALADWRYLFNGEILPDYRPALGLTVEDAEGSYEFSMLTETMADWEGPDLVRVYEILSRRDGLLRLAGQNY